MSRGIGGEGGAVGGRDKNAGGKGDVDRARDAGKGQSSRGVNPAAKAIPGFRNVALHNAGLPQQTGYGPTVGARGNNRPSGPFQSPSYSSLTPNGMPPTTGVIGGVAGLADSIINDDAYGRYGEPDLAPKDITPRDNGGSIGNTGGRDVSFGTYVNNRPPAPDMANPNPAVDKPGMSLDDYLNDIMSGFIDPNMRYYLEQRGLVDPSAPAGIPEEWAPVRDREFNFIKSTLPQDIYDPKAKEADMFNKLKTYFSDTFGDTALNNEQNRRRNQYTGALQGKNFGSQIDSKFGDTADDDLINSIIQPQYQDAQNVINNQQKRGTLTPTGYNYAMQNLDTQRKSGLNTLQGIGATERNKLRGGVDDYVSEIMGKAGQYNLGQSFDPNSFDTEFGNRLNSASGSLEGNIRSAAPTNLFNTSTTLQNAGSAQGQASRGGLLDTLASRRANGGRSRGLGSTGQF